MNKTHFCNERLGKKLSKLGCQSQLDFAWREDEIVEHTCTWNGEMTYENLTPAFHFSDILIPSNYVKIFGEPQKLGGHPFYAIYFPWDKQMNWKKWLNEAADEMLKKIESQKNEMAKEPEPTTQVESQSSSES